MSADQVTSIAGGGVPGTGLSTVTGALQGSVNNLINVGSNYIDRFFPPEKREAWKAWLVKFVTEKPHLASFLLSQVALSGPPLALFAIMTLTVFIFALLAGILVGVLGALLFIVFAVGVALLFLLPVLFFTTAAAVFVWLWGVGAYYIIKWFNQKDVPGIHTDVGSGLAKASGLSDLPGLNGVPLSAPANEAPPKAERPAKEGREGGAEAGGDKGASTTHHRREGATTSGAQHHADGKENQGSQSHPRKLAKSGAAAGGAAAAGVKDAHGAAAGLGAEGRKKIGGVL